MPPNGGARPSDVDAKRTKSEEGEPGDNPVPAAREEMLSLRHPPPAFDIATLTQCS